MNSIHHHQTSQNQTMIRHPKTQAASPRVPYYINNLNDIKKVKDKDLALRESPHAHTHHIA